MGKMTQEEINRGLFDEVQRLKQENRQLRKKDEQYKNALEFYADKSNYYPEFKDEKVSPIEFDEGQTARKALEEE